VSIVRGADARLTFSGERSAALVALEFDVDPADGSKPFVALRLFLDQQRRKVRLAGQPTLGLDFHHILLITSDQVTALRLEKDDEECRERAQGFVSAATRRSRQRYLTTRFPAEANRYEGTIAAVTPGASLVGGAEPAVQVSMAIAASQALVSLGALRDIQRHAYATLEESRRQGVKRERRAWLRRAANDLEALELDLSFTVEAQLDYRLVLPVLPVEQFHSELCASLGLASGARAASGMVNRLAHALESEYRGVNQRRADLLTAMGAGITGLSAIAVIVTIAVGFLGANVEEVLPAGTPGARSLADGDFIVYYVLLAGAPLLGGALVLGLVRRWLLR
jgi:hypothetical protein